MSEKKETREKQDTLFVGSLEKGMRVLSAFNEHHTALGLTDLANLTGLDKSAVQRLANTLHKTGYLHKDPESRRYSPALKFLELGNAYLWADPLVQLAMPKLIELGRKLGERVNVARLDGTEIVYIIRIPTQLTAFGAMVAGRRLSALTTSSGRALVSCLDPAARKEAVETWPVRVMTSKTTLDRSKIAQAVEEAAACGYGLTVSENIINEIGIAAPIPSERGRPVATVQCSVSAMRWTVDRVREEIAPHIIEVANSIHLPG
ncbi:IclR family transcriptional regulator [Nitratireductor sp. ZSWI3]|uniref:IclR family transcriptional regulator n=1 Tax=Nitratireductor sp. ZSWI3 TaxID=2966359 RepID=UPI00214FADB6|nr:IclR family transcriptional regulator [Nitratireductor sp. ZSWI3]MCR4265254.1 IclR family transcriptional regulator [Nitratireductor sp. ZSWI3]